MAKKSKNATVKARLLANFLAAEREMRVGKQIKDSATTLKRAVVKTSNRGTTSIDRSKKAIVRGTDGLMKQAVKLEKLGSELLSRGEKRRETAYQAGQKYGWSEESPPRKSRKKS